MLFVSRDYDLKWKLTPNRLPFVFYPKNADILVVAPVSLFSERFSAQLDFASEVGELGEIRSLQPFSVVLQLLSYSSKLIDHFFHEYGFHLIPKRSEPVGCER